MAHPARRSRLIPILLGLAAFAGVVAPAWADKPTTILEGPKPITVSVLPLDFDREHPDQKNFGKLIYRGGISLFASTSFFGGYSALALDPSGKSMLAISDAGLWLRAKLNYDGRKLKGISDAVIGPTLGADGKPLRDDRDRDSEGFALIDGDPSQGSGYVAFERNQRILRYPFSGDRFGPPNGTVSLPKEAKQMNSNRGIEAVTPIRGGRLKGALLVLPEHLSTKDGNLRGWLVGGPAAGPITVKSIGGFDLTDATSLADGSVLLLERRFRFSEGVKMRIRLIRAEELKPGAVINGEVLLEADDRYNIDNMEGIAAHRSAAGDLVITLISDDNFSALQRTLILQFALPAAKP